jgi:hypothetical protein
LLGAELCGVSGDAEKEIGGDGGSLRSASNDRDNFWGYSAFKDVDGSGTLTTGDTAWGNNVKTGSCGYFYWSSVFTSSKTLTKSFETAFDSLPHVY